MFIRKILAFVTIIAIIVVVAGMVTAPVTGDEPLSFAYSNDAVSFPQTSPALEQYSFPRNRLSIKIPSNWRIVVDKARGSTPDDDAKRFYSDGAFFAVTPDIAGGEEIATLNMSIVEGSMEGKSASLLKNTGRILRLSEWITLDGWLGNFYLRDLNEPFALEVDGYPAKAMDYEVLEDGVRSIIRLTVVLRSADAILITSSITDDAFHSTQLQAILGTLDIHD